MENQKKLTTKKVIEDFKVKGTVLSEEEAEKYIDLIYFFSEQAFKLYNASKTCNPIEFNSIELKKAENINYNLFAKKVLVKQV
ncbi:hypothetical protein EZ428_19460 [Pedobacter frigiditerrae]|uniref:Uncharacterized protein n=1 Tax=Pedobacter frigiditerrae TaxID=2530452 RepID=A0A4R0MPK3_9SPHI|nr:hypothetical protein [Pedobacter frigiditerrae]TCC87914.1 hypothetical protein EZ428_19460 [Pedobacter frigiditerrae]